MAGTNDNDSRVFDPDGIDWEQVRGLRRMPGMEKVLSSLSLQGLAREFCLMGIRRQYPGADEAEVMRLYRERLQLAQRLESLW
jgi:hypothetical protein